MAKLPILTEFSAKELLQMEAAIIAELRKRDLVRTNNKPLGDIAEQVVLVAWGGVLEPNSTKSHDITTPAGESIQVKAMTRAAGNFGGAFSFFRSFDFDKAVFLLFDDTTFDILLARCLTAEEAELKAGHVGHVNGYRLTLRQVMGAGEDVVAEMRAAYETLGITAAPSSGQ
ncbi:DUF6998 domain-containing protein [Dermabacteraceae bacterium P13077]